MGHLTGLLLDTAEDTHQPFSITVYNLDLAIVGDFYFERYRIRHNYKFFSFTSLSSSFILLRSPCPLGTG